MLYYALRFKNDSYVFCERAHFTTVKVSKEPNAWLSIAHVLVLKCLLEHSQI